MSERIHFFYCLSPFWLGFLLVQSRAAYVVTKPPSLPSQVLFKIGLSWIYTTTTKLLCVGAEALLVCTSESSFYGFSVQLHSIFTYFNVVKLWLFLLTSLYGLASACCINNPSVLQLGRNRNELGWVSPCNDLGAVDTAVLYGCWEPRWPRYDWGSRERPPPNTHIVAPQHLSRVLWLCWFCQSWYSCPWLPSSPSIHLSSWLHSLNEAATEDPSDPSHFICDVSLSISLCPN